MENFLGVFAHAGVDFINTDHPKECADYLKSNERTFRNTLTSEVYQPKFLYENKNIPVKTLFFLLATEWSFADFIFCFGK
jgi:alkaline phosphatase